MIYIKDITLILFKGSEILSSNTEHEKEVMTFKILCNRINHSKLNSNPYHYKLKFISTSKQNYNSTFFLSSSLGIISHKHKDKRKRKKEKKERGFTVAFFFLSSIFLGSHNRLL